MKTIAFCLICFCALPAKSQGVPSDKQRSAITLLIDKYSKARENRDTLLLKSILTSDIDQLVSTGEWREGLRSATKGMQQSSATNAGTRSLVIEKLRMISANSGVVDCRYEIKNASGAVRKMWSTFIVVSEKKSDWKIAAIRNMVPAPQ
ncbi:MAG TPA: DUF4440 domain-containing protein [Chryseosolibacter sp.]